MPLLNTSFFYFVVLPAGLFYLFLCPITASRISSPISEIQPRGRGGFIPVAITVTLAEPMRSSLGEVMPKNIMALGRPRSSLLRCGVTIGTAVWDADYEGRSQSLMVVYNSRGFCVQRNARIMQLVFLELTGETEGYNGVYQGENI